MRMFSPVGLARRLKPWRRLVRVKLLEAAGRREDAAVLQARIAPGMFRQDELRLLYGAARDAEGPGDIAEIGSWKGRSAILMSRALAHSGQPSCTIWAIDHFIGSEEHVERMVEEGGSTLETFRHNIRFAGAADVVQELPMKSVYAAQVLAERRVRLRMLFIDGAHDEASVREDIRDFLPLMRPRAIIAMHDCEAGGGFPGVWKAYLEELRPRVEELGHASSLLVTRLIA